MSEENIKNKNPGGTLQYLDISYYHPGSERGNILELEGDVIPVSVQSENTVIADIPKDYLIIKAYDPRHCKSYEFIVSPVLDKEGDDTYSKVCARLKIVKSKDCDDLPGEDD